MIDFELLQAKASSHPYPLLFATISGAHLYGFPSPDSDYDLRGVHLLPAREAVGLLPKQDTIEISGVRGGIEMDLVTHDILKFFTMLLKSKHRPRFRATKRKRNFGGLRRGSRVRCAAKSLRRNGYVLEQLYSPLIVHSTPEHFELKDIATGCITRHHSHHYLGFAATKWDLFQKEDPPRIKPLLYVYRVIQTGIHLMRTGKIEANLITLNDEFRLPYLPELLEKKVRGSENGSLDAKTRSFFEAEYMRLIVKLEEAASKSDLPEEPTSRGALNDFLVRVRLQSVPAGSVID